MSFSLLFSPTSTHFIYPFNLPKCIHLHFCFSYSWFLKEKIGSLWHQTVREGRNIWILSWYLCCVPMQCLDSPIMCFPFWLYALSQWHRGETFHTPFRFSVTQCLLFWYNLNVFRGIVSPVTRHKMRCYWRPRQSASLMSWSKWPSTCPSRCTCHVAWCTLWSDCGGVISGIVF